MTLSTNNTVTAAISAQNTFSNAIEIPKDTRGHKFMFQMVGTSTPVGTFVVQRSIDGGSTWLTVLTLSNTDFEADDTLVRVGEEAAGAQYRFGIKTGDYTSGRFTGVLSW